MDLYIHHENSQITFILKEKNTIVESVVFPVSHNLAQDFLQALDKILNKCNTKLISVKKVELSEGDAVGLTSQKIVQSIVNTLNFARKVYI